METFEEWWIRVGRGFDPDVEEVSWYDKRKFLAEAAFNSARHQSGNYVVDNEKLPRMVTFANGRIVCVRQDTDNPEAEIHFLGIGRVDGDVRLNPEKLK